MKLIAAIPGIVSLILVAILPSLPILPIVSMVLCLVSFGLIVTISRWTSSDDAKGTEERMENIRKKRLEEISKNIEQPDQQLKPTSIETLRREVKNIQAPIALKGTGVQRKRAVKEDLEKADNASYGALDDISKRVLETEKNRLDKLTSTKEEPEDSSLIIGIGAIFGIINGLGIYEVLFNYFGTLNLDSTKTSLIDMITLDMSYTLRVLGFLATIIPFIHGFVLTLTTKWYYNDIKGLYHLRLAFLFFLSVFVHTILFFLLAINVDDISTYILFLWWILLFNVIWLLVQLGLTYHVLERTDTFLLEWVIMNFNTAAYLSVFVFAYPGLLDLSTDAVDKDQYLNFQIAFVLVLRTVSDYVVGWRKVYNKRA